MAPKYRIRNWSQYQHYHHRNPPWIKLHVSILSSEDWVTLADASKLLAIACMVLASKSDGCISGDPDYVQRVAYLNKRPDFKPLIECGFLEMLADASTMLATARPEIESELELELEKKYILSKKSLNGHKADFEAWYAVFPRHEARGAAARAYAKAAASVEAGVLLAGAIRYAKSRSGQDAKFTKLPATWLNQECWLDAGGAGSPKPVNVFIAELEQLRREQGNGSE